MYRCVLSIVATDALVLKHQAISSHSANEISITYGQFQAKILHFMMNSIEKIKLKFEEMTQLFKG